MQNGIIVNTMSELQRTINNARNMILYYENQILQCEIAVKAVSQIETKQDKNEDFLKVVRFILSGVVPKDLRQEEYRNLISENLLLSKRYVTSILQELDDELPPGKSYRNPDHLKEWAKQVGIL